MYFNFLNYITKVPERFDDGNTKGYKVCTQQEFNTLVYNNFNDVELEKNVDFAKIVAYTNMCVSTWNKFVRNAIIKDADRSVITKNDLILSYTTIVNAFNDAIIKNSEEYILHDVVNYVHPRYELKGFMIKFTAIHGGRTTSPLFVLDHTDMFSVNKYMQLSQSFIAAAKSASSKLKAQRWKDYYEFKESCLLLTNIVNRQGQLLHQARRRTVYRNIRGHLQSNPRRRNTAPHTLRRHQNQHTAGHRIRQTTASKGQRNAGV